MPHNFKECEKHKAHVLTGSAVDGSRVQFQGSLKPWELLKDGGPRSTMEWKRQKPCVFKGTWKDTHL